MNNMVYNLDDVQRIQNNIGEQELSQTTLDILNNMISLLDIDVNIYNSKKDIDKRWEKQEIFKTTVILKKEGVDEKINDMRGILNKLSPTNYETKITEILSCIDVIFNEYPEESDVITKIMDMFYIIIQNNRFYVNIYVNLNRRGTIKFN